MDMRKKRYKYKIIGLSNWKIIALHSIIERFGVEEYVFLFSEPQHMAVAALWLRFVDLMNIFTFSFLPVATTYMPGVPHNLWMVLATACIKHISDRI